MVDAKDNCLAEQMVGALVVPTEAKMAEWMAVRWAEQKVLLMAALKAHVSAGL